MKASQARDQALEVLKGSRKFENNFAHANKMIKEWLIGVSFLSDLQLL